MTRRTFELVAFLAALLIATFAFHSWLASHDEQQRLQATLATQKRLLDAADAREHDRNAALTTTLAQIAKLKSATQSPEEILRDLQQELQLPQPISLAAPPAAASSLVEPSHIARENVTASNRRGTALSENPPLADLTPPTLSAPLEAGKNLPAAPSAQIPAADLKPLFDYVQDCRTCQAQLSVARQNSADDAAKIAALTRERDAAITSAKGGSFWRRLRRNAEWLAAGAAVGYVAAKR